MTTFDISARRTTRTTAAMAVVLILGCGDRTVDMAAVNGQVTMNGEPVTDVFVVFHPQPHDSVNAPTRPAMGKADEHGRYELSTNVAGDGAAVGVHEVSIVSVNRNANPPGNVPAGFQVEVKPGSNSFDLELKPVNE